MSKEDPEWENPPQSEIERILRNSRRIAVVGLSSKPSRPSNGVAAYLLEQGFEIVPVNPNETEALNLCSVSDLSSIEGRIDLVSVFRRSERTPSVVEEAIKIGAPVIWLQEGVISTEAYRKAKSAGVTIIMDRCILKEHSHLRSKREIG